MYIKRYCLSLSCVVELPKVYHLVVCKYTQKSHDKALYCDINAKMYTADWCDYQMLQ